MNRKTFLTLLAALSLAVLGAALGLADLAQAAEPPPPHVDAWLSPGTMPQAWAGAVVQCLEQPDVFYRVGGVYANWVDTNQLSRYDVVTKTWTTLVPLPDARRVVAAACYQGKIYAAGGNDGIYLSDTLYIYDIASDIWSSGANTPDGGVWGAVLGAWEGKLYLVGGTQSGLPYPPIKRVDVYDIASNTWTESGGMDMPTPASFPGSVQRGQYLYVVGGYSGDLNANVDQTQRYDMANDKWEAGPAFTSQRARIALGMTTTHLYALGGDANGGGGFDATNLVEALDLTAWPGGAWTDLGDPLPQVNSMPASACSEAVEGGEIWSIGGRYTQYNIYDTLYYRPAEACFNFYFGDLLEEELNASAMPGETASYTLRLLNAGVLTDTFDISASGLWTVTVPITVGPVAPGVTVPLLVSVEVPPGAAPMDWDTAVITVTSQGDPAAEDTAELTTYAQGWFDAGTMPEPWMGNVVQCAEQPDVFYRVAGTTTGSTDVNQLSRYDVVDEEWVPLANMPVALRAMGVTCYQGKIYAAGGWHNVVLYNTLYIYDIASDTWSSGADMPNAVWGAALGAWEGKLYLVGGTYSGGSPWAPTARVDVYDIASNTWTAVGGKPMPTPASFPGRVQRGPFLYVVGGMSGNLAANVNKTQRYDMSTDTWDAGPEFTSRRALADLGMTSTRLYAMGGDANGGGAFDATDLVEVLDLTVWPGGAWTDLGDPLPQVNLGPASACTEAIAGGEVWAIGGALNTSTPYNTLYYRPAEPCFDFYFGDLPEEELSRAGGAGLTTHYLLDLTNTSIHPDTFDIIASGLWTVTAPATIGPVAAGNTVQIAVDVAVPPGAALTDWDTALITVTSRGDPYAWDAATLTTSADGWQDAGSLAQARAGVVVQCADEPDVFYRLGGILAGGVDTDQFDRYDVITDTWTTLANMPAVRREVAAACYQGKIYAAGGYGNGAWYNTLYIYDIASNIWSSGANTLTPVWGAALGAWDGKLYLVGGTYGSIPWVPTTRVDVYDIASNTWTISGGTPMPTAASFFGSVQRGPYLYVVGGMSGNLAANVDQTQRYDMAMDTWQAGPTFTSQRALVGLGMTSTSLYALGGDANGGGGFDATDLVEVLDLTAWPGGAWTDLGDPLPQVNLSPASACTEAIAGGEVWAIGGALDTYTPYDTLYYLPASPCVHYGVDLPAYGEGAGLVGQTMDYLLTITNTSVVTDYYQLAFSSIWIVNPLPASPVMVGPGQSAQVAFGVEIPAQALDGESSITEVTATSLSNYAESDATQFTTTALGYGLDMDPGLTDRSVALGQVVTYTLTITNDGHLTDSYVVSAEGNAWEVTLPAEPVALNVDESAEVLVLVAVPLSAQPDDTDAVTITVTSQGDARISQQAVLTTTALGYVMTWDPGILAQTVQPGQVVTYTLTITNAGHLADSYVVSAEGNGWEVTLPAAPIALDVGEGAEVVVLVTVPLCAWPGQADVVTITVTSQGDARVSQEAVLTTTAGGYRVVIPMVIKT